MNQNDEEFSLAALEAAIKAIAEEATTAIALRSLSAPFTYDKRIPDLWHRTWEAHAFNLARSSIAFNLVMTLMRIWDNSNRNDVHSFRAVFRTLIVDGAVQDDVQQAIFLWLSKFDRQKELDDHIKKILEAWQRYNELKDSELVIRTKNLRHKFIAHNAAEKGDVGLPQYGFLDTLVDETVSLLSAVSVASIGHHFAFDEDAAHWSKCSELFFESLVAGPAIRRGN